MRLSERGDLLTSNEIAELAGLTYRQVDYYCRKGVISPMVDTDGSGVPRLWHVDQVPALMALAAVSTALREAGGISRIGSVALFRRVARDWRIGAVDLGHGVTLTWEVPKWPST